MKSERYYEPISCEDARSDFHALIQGKIEGENRDQLRQHLDHCLVCSIVFTDTAHEAELAGRLQPDSTVVPVSPVSIEEERSVSASVGVLEKLILQSKPTLSERVLKICGVDWKTFLQIGSRIKLFTDSLRFFCVQRQTGDLAFNIIGEMERDVTSQGILIEQASDSERASSKQSSAIIEEPPLITANGIFRFVISSTERLDPGHKVICSLHLPQNQTLHFEANELREADSGRIAIKFQVEGLPHIEEDVPIPIEQIRLYFVPNFNEPGYSR